MPKPWEAYQAQPQPPQPQPEGAPWKQYQDTIQADVTRGAPLAVREAVGGAPYQDRLTTLQKYYPDAQPYGDDNFIFTDTDGTKTLYNPEGLDFGDVVSVAREGAGMLGGAAGGAFAAATAPVTGGQSLWAAPAAVGLGTGAGMQLYDLGRNLFRPELPDTRTVPQRLVESGTEVVSGAVGQRAADIAGPVVNRALGGATRRASQVYDDFVRARVRPTAGATTGSRVIQSTEKMLANTPGGANRMQAVGQEVVDQVQRAADDVARNYGQRLSKEGTGGVMRRAARAVGNRFRARQAQIYDDVYDLIGRETPTPINNILRTRAEMAQELAQAPQSLQPALQRAIRALDDIIEDAGAGGADDAMAAAQRLFDGAPQAQGTLPFDTLRRIRTNIGRGLEDPLGLVFKKTETPAMRRVYAALSDDMHEVAEQSGSRVAQQLRRADRWTRFHSRQTMPTMDKLANMEDEQAFRWAMSTAKDGGTRLRRLRQNFTAEEWNDIAASVLGRMGLAKSSAQDATQEVFSVNTFMSNWSNLSEGAKRALFRGGRYRELAPALDRLISVVSSLKDVEKMANPSGTFRHMAYSTLLSGLGGGTVGLVASGGDLETAGYAAAGSVLAQHAAARLITNPAFVRWLAQTGEMATRPNGLVSHIGRLGALGVANPEIQEELHQYAQVLRQAPAFMETLRGRIE